VGPGGGWEGGNPAFCTTNRCYRAKGGPLTPAFELRYRHDIILDRRQQGVRCGNRRREKRKKVAEKVLELEKTPYRNWLRVPDQFGVVREQAQTLAMHGEGSKLADGRAFGPSEGKTGAAITRHGGGKTGRLGWGVGGANP